MKLRIYTNGLFIFFTFQKASEIEFETLKQMGHGQDKRGESVDRNNEPTKKNALSYLKVEGKVLYSTLFPLPFIMFNFFFLYVHIYFV